MFSFKFQAMIPEITTEEDALAAIGAVCKYLENRSKAEPPFDPFFLSNATAKLSREMCYDLLTAAGIDNRSSCDLCGR